MCASSGSDPVASGWVSAVTRAQPSRRVAASRWWVQRALARSRSAGAHRNHPHERMTPPRRSSPSSRGAARASAGDGSQLQQRAPGTAGMRVASWDGADDGADSRRKQSVCCGASVRPSEPRWCSRSGSRRRASTSPRDEYFCLSITCLSADRAQRPETSSTSTSTRLSLPIRPLSAGCTTGRRVTPSRQKRLPTAPTALLPFRCRARLPLRVIPSPATRL